MIEVSRLVRRNRHRLGSVAAAVVAAAVLAGCSSSNSGGSASSSTAPAGSAPSSASSASSASAIVAQAQAAVAKAETPLSTWDGPTTGPKIVTGKSIVAVVPASSIGTYYIPALQAAAKKVGWSVKVISLDPTEPQTWIPGLDQAIALKPNGIISFVNSLGAVSKELSEMKSLGITFISYYSGPEPGPDPAYPSMFTAITPDSYGLGKLQAELAVANSNGTARAIVIDLPSSPISHAVALGNTAEIKACTTCTLLTTTDQGLEAFTTPSFAATLMTSWVQKYGSEPFYSFASSDVFWNNMVPTLQTAGVADNNVILIGSNGDPAAYPRIRNGQYQIATTAQPYGLFAYQTIDEFNRAFHGDAPSGYVPPNYLVTKQNVSEAGGATAQYLPPVNYEAAYEKIWGIGQ